jgi:hypothetical protein
MYKPRDSLSMQSKKNKDVQKKAVNRYYGEKSLSTCGFRIWSVA